MTLLSKRGARSRQNTVHLRRNQLWLSLLCLLLIVTGCSRAPEKVPTALQVNGSTSAPIVSTKNVIAEGVVVPAHSGYLSFKLSGEVIGVHVQAGDSVQAGAPLVSLDTRELTLVAQSAEQDVLAQEAALQQLLDGASDKVIRRADKTTADQIAQAEVGLQIKELQLEKARLEDPAIGVAAARAQLRQLELTLAQTQAQDPAPAVTTAGVALERARIALADTQDEYNKALDRPWEDQVIRDTWAKRLEQAELDHQAAQAQYDGAVNNQKAYEIGLGILGAQIDEARTRLADALTAQETFSITLDILAADVEAARLQRDALKATDNPYRDQASKQEVVQARAMLEKARLALERLTLQIEDAELTAPFAGTIVDVDVEVGDLVSPTQVVVVLATLDALEIHTTDLTELDLSEVSIGQAAWVTVDALPGREFAAQVIEIALQSQDYRGDVVYEVTVVLDDKEPLSGLRWGMTTMVEIVAP